MKATMTQHPTLFSYYAPCKEVFCHGAMHKLKVEVRLVKVLQPHSSQTVSTSSLVHVLCKIITLIHKGSTREMMVQ